MLRDHDDCGGVENMKLAIPVYGHDIALVFDDADSLLLIEAGEQGLRKSGGIAVAGTGRF